MLVASPIHQILDLARWAPSGDNTQPWRFEILDEARFVIHGFDTRDHCVYDLDGHPSQISLGALIETIHIAASAFGCRVDFARRMAALETHPTFDAALIPDPSVTLNALFTAIPHRSVQRRPLDRKRLSQEQKVALEAAVSPCHRILWLDGFGQKWRTAWLMFANAELRLTAKEAYKVHRDIIHWGTRFSPDRVPDQSLGVDSMTLKVMKWIMNDWGRVDFFNRYLAGTLAPRIQMDLLPSLRCGAHFVLLSQAPPITIDDRVEAGRAVQRFWLTATTLGLLHQPELTPLIFSRYVRDGVAFSASASALKLASRLAAKSAALIGPDLANAVWIGRIGSGSPASARSTRLRLDQLLH